MPDVKWIKLKVGMFDGMSFKKIKNAKIGGMSYRDKLTAVWFELMDFAAKCNQDGAFVSPEGSPVYALSDIAVAIDRELDELQLCISFYANEGMIALENDTYVLSNWCKHQNVIGLARLKEQGQPNTVEFAEEVDIEIPPSEPPPSFSEERKAEIRGNFRQIWSAYPRKQNKQLAWEVFKQLNLPNSLMERIIAAIEIQKYQKGWMEENGRYIPSLHNWLSGRRWEDEVDEETKHDFEYALMVEEHQKKMLEGLWQQG